MPKYNDVSLALRNKIRTDMIIYNDIFGDGMKGCLTLSHHDKLLIDECQKWIDMIKAYYRTTYWAYKLTRIGRFKGVRPMLIRESYPDFIVEFEVDECEEPSWRDWFDVEGKTDGVLQGTIGTVINERTYPQYYEDGKYIFDKE